MVGISSHLFGSALYIYMLTQQCSTASCWGVCGLLSYACHCSHCTSGITPSWGSETAEWGLLRYLIVECLSTRQLIVHLKLLWVCMSVCPSQLKGRLVTTSMRLTCSSNKIHFFQLWHFFFVSISSLCGCMYVLTWAIRSVLAFVGRLARYTCVCQQPYAGQFIILIDLPVSVALCTCRVTPSTKAFTISYFTYPPIVLQFHHWFFCYFTPDLTYFIINVFLPQYVYIWMFPMLLGYSYSQSYSVREAISCMYVYLA